jgi:hypothetical protein
MNIFPVFVIIINLLISAFSLCRKIYKIVSLNFELMCAAVWERQNKYFQEGGEYFKKRPKTY